MCLEAFKPTFSIFSFLSNVHFIMDDSNISSNNTRSIGSLETWEPADKSFSKHILKTGHSDETPCIGALCTVFIISVGM